MTGPRKIPRGFPVQRSAGAQAREDQRRELFGGPVKRIPTADGWNLSIEGTHIGKVPNGTSIPEHLQLEREFKAAYVARRNARRADR